MLAILGLALVILGILAFAGVLAVSQGAAVVMLVVGVVLIVADPSVRSRF